MQWDTQAGSITTNIKGKIYFTLPRLSAKNRDVKFSCA